MPKAEVKIVSGHKVQGEIVVAADKSISHRALIFGALAAEPVTINNILKAEDTWATLAAVRSMGASVTKLASGQVIVSGSSIFTDPDNVIDCGNSGTAMRLLTGALAGQGVYAVLTGDDSLRSRPMGRIIKPLSQMGCQILSRHNLAPLTIMPNSQATGIEYHSPVASAQVKSCLLLAGLGASGSTTVYEPALSRDHSERMFRYLGARIETDSTNKSVTIWGGSKLGGGTIYVPGDISSAAFFMVAAAITPGSKLLIKNVGVNPTRTGIIDALRSMGAKIFLQNETSYNNEPVADIYMEHAPLTAATIGGAELIPRLIDELPVIAVAAAMASGTTVIYDAAELKVKESNRIKSTVRMLMAFGVAVSETSDGLVVEGQGGHHAATVDAHGDHRIAMAAAILAGALPGECTSTILDTANVDTSFPSFWNVFNRLK